MLSRDNIYIYRKDRNDEIYHFQYFVFGVRGVHRQTFLKFVHRSQIISIFFSTASYCCRFHCKYCCPCKRHKHLYDSMECCRLGTCVNHVANLTANSKFLLCRFVRSFFSVIFDGLPGFDHEFYTANFTPNFARRILRRMLYI